MPNVARIYDYLLGGKDNFAADREAAGLALRAVPQMRSLALENRQFPQRGAIVRVRWGRADFERPLVGAAA